MLARRLLIALAVLMALTALAASLAPRKTAPQREASATRRRPSQAAREPVEETLDAAAEGQRVVARVGQTVTIIVRSDTLDTVTLAELGAETTEPDSPAHFELLADAPGTYPIELLEADRPDRRARDPRVGSTKGGPRTARPWSHGVAWSCDYQLEPLQPPPRGRAGAGVGRTGRVGDGERARAAVGLRLGDDGVARRGLGRDLDLTGAGSRC